MCQANVPRTVKIELRAPKFVHLPSRWLEVRLYEPDDFVGGFSGLLAAGGYSGGMNGKSGGKGVG